MWFLVDNVQVNKIANCRDNLTWADVVVIHRDQLTRVALVPTGTIIGVSTMIEMGIPGVVEVPELTREGLVVVSNSPMR